MKGGSSLPCIHLMNKNSLKLTCRCKQTNWQNKSKKGECILGIIPGALKMTSHFIPTMKPVHKESSFISTLLM